MAEAENSRYQAYQDKEERRELGADQDIGQSSEESSAAAASAASAGFPRSLNDLGPQPMRQGTMDQGVKDYSRSLSGIIRQLGNRTTLEHNGQRNVMLKN
eukprot:5289425-Amphidinium_carterae.1